MQLAYSPGCKYIEDLIVITAMLFLSSSCNCRGTDAGASNATEPSSATGTVPTIVFRISFAA